MDMTPPFLSFALIVWILLLPACGKSRSCSEELAGDSFKYWRVPNPVDSMRTARTLYYFDTSGKWLAFTLRANGEMESAFPDDVIFTERWSSAPNGVVISGDTFSIACTVDTVVLNSSRAQSARLISVSMEDLPAQYRQRR